MKISFETYPREWVIGFSYIDEFEAEDSYITKRNYGVGIHFLCFIVNIAISLDYTGKRLQFVPLEELEDVQEVERTEV